jgi:hypothetical protein
MRLYEPEHRVSSSCGDGVKKTTGREARARLAGPSRLC